MLDSYFTLIVLIGLRQNIVLSILFQFTFERWTNPRKSRNDLQAREGHQFSEHRTENDVVKTDGHYEGKLSHNKKCAHLTRRNYKFSGPLLR